MKSDFVNLFDNITTPKDQAGGLETFNSNPIQEFSNSHIGKDSLGRPVIILRILDKDSSFLPVISLENLRVENNIHCRILPANGPSYDGRFFLVHCTSTDRNLHIYFLQTMEVVLQYITEDTTTYELSMAINKLVELFHALRKPPSGTTQGLWAELFLIVRANNPRIMIESWHSEATELYDFSSDNHCIEAKCSSNRMRQHFFSYEQAYPPPGTSVLVASLFVESATNGTTLGELWDRVRDLALSDSDLRMKIESVCLNTLGSTWHNARQKSFDEQLARQSLALFNINDIPRVSKKHPDGVSDIRFRSDLSRVKPIAPIDCREYGLLFASCIPK